MNFFVTLLRKVLRENVDQSERLQIIKELKSRRNSARISKEGFNKIMRTYLVEYIEPRTQVRLTTYLDAEDKTAARDLFFETYPAVEEVERITWVPSIEA
jgi:hypothetical protein